MLETNLQQMSTTIAQLKRKLLSMAPATPAGPAAATGSTPTVTVISLPFAAPPQPSPFQSPALPPHAVTPIARDQLERDDGVTVVRRLFESEPDGSALATATGGVLCSADSAAARPPTPLERGPYLPGDAGIGSDVSSIALSPRAAGDGEASTVPKVEAVDRHSPTGVGLAISTTSLGHQQEGESGPLSAFSSPGETARSRLDDVLTLERSVSVLTSHPALVSPVQKNRLLQPSVQPAAAATPVDAAVALPISVPLPASCASPMPTLAASTAESGAMQSAAMDVDEESTRSGSRARSRRRSSESEELDIYLDAFEPESESPQAAQSSGAAEAEGDEGRERAASVTERSSVCSCVHEAGTVCSCTSAPPSRCSTSPCSVSPLDELPAGGRSGARPRKSSRGGSSGKRRRVSITQASASITTPLSSFTVVWAKMVGYPWYPAIVCCSFFCLFFCMRIAIGIIQ